MNTDYSNQTPPSHEDISARARELWEKAGSPADRDLEFWLAAEAALVREREQPSRSANVPAGEGNGNRATSSSRRRR